MTKTIQAALSPLLITGSFCGLCFFEYPLGRSRPYISCLYFSITWSLYAYSFYYLAKYSGVPIFLSWTNIIITVAVIMSIFVSLYRFKEMKMCLYKFSIVDDTLEILGMSKNYKRLYNWMIRVIVGWIIISCLANTIDFYWLGHEHYINIISICIPFVANHMIHVNTLNGFIWGTILRYVSSRFQRINEYISNNLVKDETQHTGKENMLISVRQRIESKECKQHLWIIMHVHLQLCHISRELNKVFSIQMTLEMASIFTFLVELFIDFYELWIDEEVNTFYQIMESLLIYIFAVIFIIKLLALNYICQMVYDKINGTITILYKLLNDSSDKELREQILQFILQIKQREVKFSGMGLFYLGYSFIRKFFMSIMTVVVIIIQNKYI